MKCRFVVLRTPLLPFDTLSDWTRGTRAAGAWQAGDEELAAALREDRERLRARLREIVLKPELSEALSLASTAMAEVLRAPASKRFEQAEATFVRYLLRMSARPTPFGLFSGHSLGEVGHDTCLQLAARAQYRRRTRLDGAFIAALGEALVRDPEIRSELSFRPNPDLYAHAGELRYFTREASDARVFQLTAVERSPWLEAALTRAQRGARPAQIARALAQRANRDAARFVESMIDARVVVAEVEPAVSGADALTAIARTLRRGGAACRRAAAELAPLQTLLHEADAAPLGAGRDLQAQVTERLARFVPQKARPPLQSDLLKPAPRLSIDSRVVAEVAKAVRLLHAIARPSTQRGLERFRDDYEHRYGTQRVRLVDALDPEYGIGFASAHERAAWGPVEDARLELLHRAWAQGAHEVVLSEADCAALSNGEGESREPLPDALAALVSVAASTEAAFARGEFRVLVHTVDGPSGARLLGRACAIDPALHARVAEHLREEEALRPGVVFAEVLALPKPHHRNVMGRPVLRDYEISFVCRSGAPRARQLPLADLLLAIEDGRIALRSERLGREVAPRFSCALNTDHPENPPILRFLGALQTHAAQDLRFDWGPLVNARFLPRIRHGRAVLAVAQWRLPAADLRVTGSADAPAFRRVQELRTELRWPRFVSLEDGEAQLAIDLDNPLCVDALLRIARAKHELRVAELFPEPGELCVRGPEGRYAHELVIPFVAARPASRAERPSPAPARSTAMRARMPGTDWLYLKVYAGVITGERLLRERLAPILRRAIRAGAADRWFFVRYLDPEPHLRVRVHGPPRRLAAEVLPAVASALQSSLGDRSVWRVQLDTYEPEVERYGGLAGLDVAEQVFFHDSAAVLRVLGQTPTLAERRHAAIVGTDALLRALGLDSEQRLELVKASRDALAREHAAAPEARRRSAFCRAQRGAVAALFAPRNPTRLRLLRAFAARDAELVRAGRRLCALERQKRLGASRHAIFADYAHLHNNRLFLADQRRNELLVLELLYRQYRSPGAP